MGVGVVKGVGFFSVIMKCPKIDSSSHVMVLHICDRAKKHCIVHFTWAKGMVCELQLNKAG